MSTNKIGYIIALISFLIIILTNVSVMNLHLFKSKHEVLIYQIFLLIFSSLAGLTYIILGYVVKDNVFKIIGLMTILTIFLLHFIYLYMILKQIVLSISLT